VTKRIRLLSPIIPISRAKTNNVCFANECDYISHSQCIRSTDRNEIKIKDE
jgi:hypothetical protein